MIKWIEIDHEAQYQPVSKLKGADIPVFNTGLY